MLIEPAVYLAAVIDDFLAAGGRLVVRSVGSREDIERLDEAVVVNCTGLGSRASATRNWCPSRVS
jgi:hypothetical protein